jgi:tetratricopeptide (TPR) repeat protein
VSVTPPRAAPRSGLPAGLGSAAVGAALQTAFERLRLGQVADAYAVLSPLVQTQPRIAEARYLFGLALEKLGDLAQAEGEYRAAIGLDKRKPQYHLALGDVLVMNGDAKAAERSFRAALGQDRRFAPAAVSLANLLAQAGRFAEALQATTPIAAAADADEQLLSAHAVALKGLERPEESLEAYRRAVAVAPQSGVAEHNVAAASGDLMLYPQAEASARRAFAKGLDAAETWLTLGRALQGQDRFDEADHAYREAIRRRPNYADAYRSLTHLIWMRSENLAAAAAPLDVAIGAFPDEIALRLLKSSLYDYAGETAEAYAVLAEALELDPGAVLHTAAGRASVPLDPLKAIAHAEAALALAPNEVQAHLTLCEAQLAAGRADDAERTAEGLRRALPRDQHVLAYLATAWRLKGDPRYHELYDYARLVRPWRIDRPDGWSSLSAYLVDLKAALERLHNLRTHPVGQSLRQGTQTGQSLRHSQDPAIQAFFQAIDGPIRAHIAELGNGKDPLRARSLGGYAIKGIWSVRLRPGGGHHVDHIHQEGWLSSACYIDLPPAIEADGRQGWIKFGEPGAPTQPRLGPEHFVKPEPGLLVLFPSYMWHGTVPFSGEASRLTAAFDLLPAKPGDAR